MDHNRTKIHPKPHTNKIHQPTKLHRIQKTKTKNINNIQAKIIT